ncbi:hypothetical protein ACHAQH_007581 [Verticillium albo-atrum]
MDDDDSAEERYMELETLEAIFPEIQKLTSKSNPRSNSPTYLEFSLELPVHPANPVTVLFPAASNPANPQDAAPGDGPVDSHELVHLPAVLIRIALPPGYPAEQPPSVTISTTPPWLTPETVEKLQQDGPRMWADAGRNLVAFDYIDHVQQAADAVFEMIDDEGTLKVDPLHKLAILDYDIQARRAAFARETFDCGVCLEPKKGSVCHQMLDCRHVFCAACLLDFYGTAITEGDLATVRCLVPNCAKDRAAAAAAAAPAGASSSTAKRKKVKTNISPSELLQIGLSQELVTRYVTLMYKTELESDKNTIYCPRSWCEGAARSKKHKKPTGLELGEASDDSDDAGPDAEAAGDGTRQKKKKKKEKKAAYDPADLLSICEECGFAFCSRCCQSWHGEFVSCMPPRDTGELSVEEQASIDYLKLHSTPCPTCAAPAQKTHGCNHMICFRCNSHFCYLCSAWLDPANPYQHFNEQPGGKRTSCYMRLWELEEGDGDDVGYGFAGGPGGDQAPPPPALLPDDFDDVPPAGDQALANDGSDSDSDSDSDDDDGQEVDAPRPQNDAPGAVAREGPLVLRIGGDPRPRVVVPPPPAPQAPPGRGRGGHYGANQARGGRGRGRGNHRGAGVRGGGGARQNAVQERAGGNMPRRIPVRHGDGADEMNPQDAAWVRNFVQMALADVEDDSDGDADDVVLFPMAQ